MTSSHPTGLFLALMLISTVLVSGCTKDSSNPTTSGGSSLSAKLTATSWKYQTLEFQNQDGSWYSASPLPSDAAGVVIAFNSNGSFTDSGGWNPHTGTWKLSGDGKTLTTEIGITYGSVTTSANSTITTLSSTTLQIVTTGSLYETGPDGFPHTYYAERDTFVH